MAAGKPGGDYGAWKKKRKAAPPASKPAVVPSKVAEIGEALSEALGKDPVFNKPEPSVLRKVGRAFMANFGDSPEVMAHRISDRVGRLMSDAKWSGGDREGKLARMADAYLESPDFKAVSQRANLFDEVKEVDSRGTKANLRRATIATLMGIARQADLRAGLAAARQGPEAYKRYLDSFTD